MAANDVNGVSTDSRLTRAHFIAGMLTFGTVTGITMKMQLLVNAIGWGGEMHSFAKPFFQSLGMFVAMAGSLIIFHAERMFSRRNVEMAEVKNGSVNAENKAARSRRDIFLIAIPTLFDLIASTMMTFGLIPLTASIFQMLRGSMVLFSAFLSVIFLKRRLWGYHYMGIVVCAISLVMVGIAGVHSESPGQQWSVSQQVAGCFLVIGSQFIQAGQIVAEEFILKNVEAPAMKIVGWEGVWGTIFTLFIACPLAYVIPGDDVSSMPHGSMENTIDSFIMLGHSSSLAIIFAVFMVAVLAYNIYGMSITSTFTAVHRTIFEAMRTACIWIVDLIIHVAWPTSIFGEQWSAWSWLELAGFIVLVFSSTIYNGIVKIPGFAYPEPEPEKPLLDNEQDETREYGSINDSDVDPRS